MQRYSMAKPPIEYRPRFNALRGYDPITREDAMAGPDIALEAYKASERAKVLKRVRKHRAKKKGTK